MDLRRLLFAFALICLTAPAHAESVDVLYPGPGYYSLMRTASASSVPWAGTSIDFSHKTFELDFESRSQPVYTPSLGDLGVAGRLDAIRFYLGGYSQVRITHDFIGVEIVPDYPIPTWQTHGNYYFSGKLSVLSNGSTIGTLGFAFTIFSGCGGLAGTTFCAIGEMANEGFETFVFPTTEILVVRTGLFGFEIDRLAKRRPRHVS